MLLRTLYTTSQKSASPLAVALGPDFLPLSDQLQRGTEVIVNGYTQGRDLHDGRTVVEIVARQVAVVNGE